MINKLAANLKQLRIDEGLKQRELADKIGTSQRVISCWETGITQPDLDSLMAIAVFFKVSTDYILGLEE